MYSIVLATMLTAGTATPDFFFFRPWAAGCCGGYAGCCGGCYGGCYGGCWGGGYAAYSGCCGGCCGGCYGCYGSCCGGCYGSSYYPPVFAYSGCCGGCCGGGCTGFAYSGGHIGYSGSCFGSSSCFGGAIGTGFSGCYGSCSGCYGGGYSYAPSTSGVTYGMASATPTASSGPATVIVRAPMAAKIEVNGFNLARKSEEQSFATPTLSATGKHTYEFTATLTRDGQPVTKTQTIEVRPGSESRVDFTELFADAGPKKERARVVVTLPEEAELFVDDVKMSATTSTRKFQTPLLEVGRTYSYELRARMMRDGQMHEATQRVRIEPGQEVPVEFTSTSFVKINARTVSR
jgi:uncharacterized protein (TIGR03000 family)